MLSDKYGGEAAGVLMIEEVKKLIAKSFPGELTEQWTEGSIDAALKLCADNSGLKIHGDRCAAFFRYWPKDKETVANMDFAELEEMDLTTGPLLHIVLLINHSSLMVRWLAVFFNVWGVTAHRWDKRNKTWRFAARKNARFVDVGRMVADGFTERRQQQEQEQI